MRKLLYSNGSPFARRVRIVLIEKGLDFESDIYDAVRPIEDIRPHNPALQVPVLYDGERHLFGSNLILHYLFATYTDAAGTQDVPLAPTPTRTEQHWDDSLTLTAIESLADSLVNVRFMMGTADEAAYLGRQRQRIGSCLDWLEQRVTPQGFWPGTFSLMDINLMCPLMYGEKRDTFDFRSGRWPNTVAMIERWQDRPSVKATPVNEAPGRR